MKHTVLARCFCGKVNEVRVEVEAYNRWQGGELIQVVFPDLSAEERELLISGTCPSCWDAMFGEEEDGES